MNKILVPSSGLTRRPVGTDSPQRSSNQARERHDGGVDARRRHSLSALIAAFTLIAVTQLQAGCRGYSTSDPPIHLNPNMDTQEKGRPYRASDFFDDGQYMRTPIAGTIARGKLKEDEHFYFGKMSGELAHSFPKDVVLDEAFLRRGQVMFDRTCAACHAHVGNGEGLVGRRLLVKPTSLHSEYMYGLPPGHYFDVISNGIRTMQGYKHMMSPRDRWAVTAYIRSLQMSQDMDGEWIQRSASWWTQR